MPTLATAAVTEEPTENPARAIVASRSRQAALLRQLAPILVLVAMVVPANLVHVARLAAISPFDELMHIDYLYKASKPGFLRPSDRFSQEAMHEIACRGHPSQALPPCGAAPYSPEDFSWKGVNLASGHSIYYYAITGLTGRALAAVLPGGLVTWGRVLGSAWLLAGLLIALRIGVLLGVPQWSLVPALAVVALSPSPQHAATTINPDASAIFAGSVVLYATVKIVAGSARPVWLLAASLGAMLLDPGNLLAVLAVMLYVVLAAGLTIRKRVALVGLLATGVVASEVIGRMTAAILRPEVDVGSIHDVWFAVDNLTGPMVWGQSALLSMLPPTRGYVFAPMETEGHIVAALSAVMLASTGLVAGAVQRMRVGESDRLHRLIQAGLITLVLGGPLLIVVRFVSSGNYFPIPPRYGLSVVPIVALSIATVVAVPRFGRALVGGIGVALALTTAVALL